MVGREAGFDPHLKCEAMAFDHKNIAKKSGTRQDVCGGIEGGAGLIDVAGAGETHDFKFPFPD